MGMLHRVLSGASLVALAVPGMAHAQETPAPPRDDQVEDIVITAQRRPETLLDAPISISAFTGDTLIERGITNVEGLAEITPSLQIFAEQVNNEAFIIRGIGRSNEDLTTDSGVAVYLNDIYLPQPSEANAAFYDIERVEVLRGPQGTLYGKNAVGGVVNIITRPPTRDFEGYLIAEMGTLAQRNFTGAAGGPLADGVSARIAGYSSSRNGAYRNLTTGERANDVEQQALRASLRLEPTERLTINLVADISDTDQNGVLKSVIVDEPGARYILKDFFEVDEFPGQEEDIRSARSETNGRQGIRQWGGALRTDYEADFGTISWLAGYRTERSYNLEDIDRTERLINNFEANQETWATSQELRFVSDDSGPLSMGGRLHWTAGLYWFHEEGDRDQFIYLRGRVPGSQPGDPDDPDNGLLGPGTPDAQDSTARFFQRINTDSFAVFGQATFDITSRLSATLGLRYTNEEKRVSLDATSTATLPGGDPYTLFQPDGPFSTTSRARWNRLTPRAVLEYEIADRVNAYLSYARGFKSGGYNGQAGTAADLEPFDPEVADSYEAGVHAELFDRRLRLSAAAFWVDLQGLQVAGTNAQGLVVTSNAADSRITGLELEAVARPFRGLELRGGLSLLHARFRNYFVEEFDPTIVDGPPFVIVDKEGDRLDDVPEYLVNFGARYTLPLPGGSSLRFGADATFKGDTLSNQNTLRANSYGVFNAQIGWTSADERWDISAWVRNITDEVYYRGGGAVPDFDKFVARVGLVADPRTAGVTVRLNFGG
jgi:iron complex outermembrane receptor protein